jgi:predicted Zn-dependent peptidase
MISFLFCLGVSLFAALPHSQTVEINDPLPLDEKVYVRNFTNGVTAYVQENKSPKNSASLSIVIKGEQSDSFTIDSINLEEMDAFFAKCKEKIQTKAGKSCAVIAVGDFAGRSVADLIEKHFSTIRFESLSKEPEAPSQMIGLKIAYEVPRTPLRTMADLKKKWVQALSQHILHCRIQAAVNCHDLLSSIPTS